MKKATIVGSDSARKDRLHVLPYNRGAGLLLGVVDNLIGQPYNYDDAEQPAHARILLGAAGTQELKEALGVEQHETPPSTAVAALLRCLNGDAQSLALDNETDRAALVHMFCAELENLDE